MKRPARGAILALNAAGLLGICLFPFALRAGGSFLPADDFGLGLWVGVSIGCQAASLLLMLKAKSQPSA